MTSSSEPFRFKISSKNGQGKKIPLSIIANGFQKIQSLVYILGDQIEGNEFRSAGNYPNQVKERYELALSSLHIGSADSFIVPASPLQSLGQMLSPAEQAISLMNQVISVISEYPEGKLDISEIIPDERRKKKFARELADFWPNEETPYIYEIGTGTSSLTRLLPEKRNEILRIQKQFHPVHEVRDIYGRITSLNVNEKRKILIETPEGEISGHYIQDIEGDLIDYLGSFVHFEAILKLSNGKFYAEIDDTIAIEHFDEFPLEYAVINNQKKRLSSPLTISIEYIDEQYHLENPKFLLETYATRLKDAMDNILDQLELLYLEYGICDPAELTPDALDLSNSLLSHFEG
jgi:hypothetical protein